jgi:hypothetical protein
LATFFASCASLQNKRCMKSSFPILIGLLYVSACSAQPQTTANQYVPPFNDGFGYGTNMGVYPPYTDESLATLVHGSPDGKVPGVGVTTIRPALYEHFVEEWGYDIRLNAFKLYDSIGLENLTVFIGFPSEAHRDTARYCNEGPPETFKGMYLDIWDGGANGTPVNDNNTYALYVWKLANTYKGLIRYYEVMNEPDFDMKGNAWKPASMPGNWWTNTPQPCEMALRAPVTHYVRMLRISYEVIKTVDPSAYIAIGGIGYPSFLDVVCRSSDNPNGGTLTSKYPLKGGAYFDVLSYHSYPHIDGSMREWDTPSARFKYFRHSDAALDGVFDQRDKMKLVLEQYGYNGQTYPEKHWIITEINIPRKQYGDFIGSNEAQTNFMMKALITGQKEKIDQMCIYNLSDVAKVDADKSEFELMGLFKNLNGLQPFDAIKNQVAIGFHTTSMLLKDLKYDAAATAALQLPSNIRGVGFSNAQGKTIYALWAKTDIDRNEHAEATYSFALGTQTQYLYQRFWDYSETGASILINARDTKLSSTPSFFEKAIVNDLAFPKEFKVFPNPVPNSNQVTMSFFNYEEQKIDIEVFDVKGRLVQTIARQQNFVKGGHQILVNLSLQASGTYFIRLRTLGGIQTVPVIHN